VLVLMQTDADRADLLARITGFNGLSCPLPGSP